MDGEPRMTRGVLRVMRLLLDAPGGEMFGTEVIRATGMKSGALYPMLDRLEAAGWITCRQEDPGDAVRRPRRRYFRLTEPGAMHARASLALAAAELAPSASTLPLPAGAAPHA